MARLLNDVIALLNRLIQIEKTSIDTYKTAKTRLGDAVDRVELGAFLADHRRHVDALTIVVRNLGGEPVSHGDMRQVRLRGSVDLRGLIEEGLLIEAVRSNEAEATASYENAASQPGIPVDVVAVLKQNLTDERRHQAWIVARLEAARGVGPGRSK
ncbi:MAG TPA: DUF2383 domain-containing protein [Polyangiaceae bacterium]|nr:DUF2383 domain-containing protein [Polyangiaceae bacterium]